MTDVWKAHALLQQFEITLPCMRQSVFDGYKGFGISSKLTSVLLNNMLIWRIVLIFVLLVRGQDDSSSDDSNRKLTPGLRANGAKGDLHGHISFIVKGLRTDLRLQDRRAP
jgi:hypothetical protein